MALSAEKNANFASFSGTPDAAYQTIDFDFKSNVVKFIVANGSLEVSLTKSDTTPHMILLPGEYTFVGLALSRLFVRNVTATGSQILAWAN